MIPTNVISAVINRAEYVEDLIATYSNTDCYTQQEAKDNSLALAETYRKELVELDQWIESTWWGKRAKRA